MIYSRDGRVASLMGAMLHVGVGMLAALRRPRGGLPLMGVRTLHRHNAKRKTCRRYDGPGQAKWSSRVILPL